jgi:hypothetical protein
LSFPGGEPDFLQPKNKSFHVRSSMRKTVFV